MLRRISILPLAGIVCVGCTVSVRPPFVPPPPPPTVAVTVAPAAPEPAAPAPPAEEAAPPADSDAQADTYDDQDPTALQDFHPVLDAHGTWVDDPTYGTVWIPNAAEVGPDFVPYVGGGHWVYGDDYLWVSDYDWGWVPFHYGRWAVLGSGVWGWIPGREYAPAWVVWQVGDDYVGWAPAPPEFIWRGGVVVTEGFVAPEPQFAFCAQGDLFSPTPSRLVIRGARADAIRGRTHAYADAGGHGGHHGPPPSSMRIPPSKVAHATGHERGAEQARNFGHPSTAQRMGAHPPAKRVANASRGARPGRAEERTNERAPEREAGRTPEREPGREASRAPEREPGRAQSSGDAARGRAGSPAARPAPARPAAAKPAPAAKPAARPSSKKK